VKAAGLRGLFDCRAFGQRDVSMENTGHDMPCVPLSACVPDEVLRT
jgi:hypothetical protein